MMATIDRCDCPKFIPVFLIADSRCQDCGKLPLRHNEIWCGDALLIVQSCDDDEANIGVFLRDLSTYYHVDLPSLKRQWRSASFSPTDLGHVVFDTVLRDYSDDILALIARLNGKLVVA